MTPPRPTIEQRSAGLLLYRWTARGQMEVLIGHMGGPFWVNRDDGGWSIPKGEYGADEQPLAAARREFEEEIGHSAPAGDFIDLGELPQSSGKLVHVWALEGDLDASRIESNTFELEWPPRSGQQRTFPEIDRAAWFELKTARRKLVRGQQRFIELLRERVAPRASSGGGRQTP